MLTAATLKRLWPRAPKATITAITEAAGEVLGTYRITTPLRLAHFLAQISHECGGGTIVRENMSYSAARMMQIFGLGRHSAKVTADEARMLQRRPEAIAERVYGLGNPKKARELGNARPGDGFRFRGGGMLQLTGGASYRKMGEAAGVDLYGDPDLIADPKVSFRVAAAEFVALNCLPAADKDDLRLVTRRVNGGYNGLADREAWLRKWKAALDAGPDDTDEAPPPRGAEAQPDKPLSQSKIAWGGGGLGIAGATEGLGAVNEAAGEVAKLKDNAADIGVIEILSALVCSPRFWIAAGIVVVAGLVIYWRWRDHQ